MKKEEIIEVLADHIEWLHDNEIIFKSDIDLIGNWIEVNDYEVEDRLNKAVFI